MIVYRVGHGLKASVGANAVAAGFKPANNDATCLILQSTSSVLVRSGSRLKPISSSSISGTYHLPFYCHCNCHLLFYCHLLFASVPAAAADLLGRFPGHEIAKNR